MSVNNHFYDLKVKQLKKETADATSITFDIPEEHKEIFKYLPGQYLTLKFTLKGGEVRRAYSLSSSPAVDNDLTVTIKKVKGGLVSTHINDVLKEGELVSVMAPQGRFTTPIDHNNKKDYFLVGGGSGITPLISIAKSVLETEPKSKVHLLYGNNNEDSIIFKADLEGLERRFAGQFTITHILAKPKTTKEGGFLGMFAKTKTDWNGLTGFVNDAILADFVKKNKSSDGRDAEHFICGPSPMMKIAESYFQKAGVAENKLHVEWFLDSSAPKPAAVGGVDGATVIATLNGKKYEFTLEGKETILDALRRLSADPPYSCLAGACATCMAKVTSGSVKMDSCFALDSDEISKGIILSCQARPTSEMVEVNFDI